MLNPVSALQRHRPGKPDVQRPCNSSSFESTYNRGVSRAAMTFHGRPFTFLSSLAPDDVEIIIGIGADAVTPF